LIRTPKVLSALPEARREANRTVSAGGFWRSVTMTAQMAENEPTFRLS
jgi:hypothetical protein